MHHSTSSSSSAAAGASASSSYQSTYSGYGYGYGSSSAGASPGYQYGPRPRICKSAFVSRVGPLSTAQWQHTSHPAPLACQSSPPFQKQARSLRTCQTAAAFWHALSKGVGARKLEAAVFAAMAGISVAGLLSVDAMWEYKNQGAWGWCSAHDQVRPLLRGLGRCLLPGGPSHAVQRSSATSSPPPSCQYTPPLAPRAGKGFDAIGKRASLVAEPTDVNRQQPKQPQEPLQAQQQEEGESSMPGFVPLSKSKWVGTGWRGVLNN